MSFLDIGPGIENALRGIRKRRAKLALVQVPEGLKAQGAEIARMVERGTGAVAVLSAEPCYGACGIADDEAKALGADLVLHIGHAKMPNLKSGVRTVFVPLRYEIGAGAAEETAEKIKKTLAGFMRGSGAGSAKGARETAGFGKVALCATVQYVHFLPKLKKTLERTGVKAFIGKGGARIAERGQVLGCDCSSVRAAEKRADAIVFVGDGMFHPIAVSYCSKKPVIMVDPKATPETAAEKTNTNRAAVSVFVFDAAAEREKFIRRRFGAIARAGEAKVFGIIVSTKAGQLRKKAALNAKRLIEAKGKTALLVSAPLVREEYFAGMGIDCFVSTACPRIALEDGLHWKKPVLTVPELEILLGKRKAGDYAFDMLG